MESNLLLCWPLNNKKVGIFCYREERKERRAMGRMLIFSKTEDSFEF